MSVTLLVLKHPWRIPVARGPFRTDAQPELHVIICMCKIYHDSVVNLMEIEFGVAVGDHSRYFIIIKFMHCRVNLRSPTLENTVNV